MILPNWLSVGLKMVGGVRAAIFASLLVVVSGIATFEHFHVIELKASVVSIKAANEHERLVYQQDKEALERKHVEDTAVIALKTQKERQDEEKVIAKLNADVKSGNLKLRDKFICKVRPSEVGPASSGVASSDGAILSDEDQQFLIQQATAADEAVRQRNEAVEIAKKDRGQ